MDWLVGLIILIGVILIIKGIYGSGKNKGFQEAYEQVLMEQRQAERIRDNVEDRVRNATDTELDDQLGSFMRDSPPERGDLQSGDRSSPGNMQKKNAARTKR